MNITVEEVDGTIYYSTENRGVEYSLYFVKAMGMWGISSHRKSLVRRNTGGFRYFKDLEELERTLKCFRGISCLIAVGAEA